MKQEQIKIPISLFFNVYSLITALKQENLSPKVSTYVKEIETQINDKLERINAREKFTAYKTAKTDTEKSKHLENYLDTKGVHKNFKY